jgi:5-methylcytosine-specific restriction endonuclease McrA
VPRKTPPFKPYPDWTTARFFGFIRSGLREKFNRYPPKYESIKQAAITIQDGEYKTGAKKGKPKYAKRYRCASCEQLFMQKDVQVDHIIPAGSLKSFADLPSFVERLFCGPDGLQVMCKPCHKIKTEEEK